MCGCRAPRRHPYHRPCQMLSATVGVYSAGKNLTNDRRHFITLLAAAGSAAAAQRAFGRMAGFSSEGAFPFYSGNVPGRPELVSAKIW